MAIFSVPRRLGRLAIAAVALLLALFAAANGVAMLADPHGWFWRVPGVPLTGGYNAHFIRDIGIVYLLAGFAVLWGLFRSRDRRTLWGAAAAWFSGHAVFHVVEVAAGICGPDAIVRDFLGVTVPGLAAFSLFVVALAGGPRNGDSPNL